MEIDGASVTFSYEENSNYIQVPPAVIGINKVFRFDNSTISGGMFSLKYQLFLNYLDFYHIVCFVGIWGYIKLL